MIIAGVRRQVRLTNRARRSRNFPVEETHEQIDQLLLVIAAPRKKDIEDRNWSPVTRIVGTENHNQRRSRFSSEYGLRARTLFPTGCFGPFEKIEHQFGYEIPVTFPIRNYMKIGEVFVVDSADHKSSQISVAKNSGRTLSRGALSAASPTPDLQTNTNRSAAMETGRTRRIVRSHAENRR